MNLCAPEILQRPAPQPGAPLFLPHERPRAPANPAGPGRCSACIRFRCRDPRLGGSRSTPSHTTTGTGYKWREGAGEGEDAVRAWCSASSRVRVCDGSRGVAGGGWHLPAPRAARALGDVIMCKRPANAMIEMNGGSEGSSLGGRLITLLPCQRGPHRRVRTYCHSICMTLHYGNYHYWTSNDGQVTAVLFNVSLNDVLIEKVMMTPLLR